MRSHVRGAEDVELRQHRRLRIQTHFLAVAQRTVGTRERSDLRRLREQADEVRHLAHFAHAGPERLVAAGVAFMAGQCGVATQAGGRILRVQRIVGSGDRRLVGQDVHSRCQAGDLHRGRGDVVVADQDVLVFFLDQFVAGRHDHFDHVFARQQHRRAVTVRVAGVRIGGTSRAIGTRRLAGHRVQRRHAGEAVHAVVWRRLQLVPGVHAVVALVLRAVRKRVRRRAAVLRVVPIEVLRLVLQGVEERVNGVTTGVQARLARAAHVRLAVRAEALHPVVPARGIGVVDQRERRCHAIGGHALLVQVDTDVRDQRLPAQLQQQLRGVERPGRGVDDVAVDRAGLARCEGLLAELQEIALADVALPAVGAEPVRRIDAAGRVVDRRRQLKAVGDALESAVCVGAGNGTRRHQFWRQRVLLIGVGQTCGDARGAARAGYRIARLGTVGRTAGVVDHVRAGALVARGVGLDRVPVEQREDLVEARIAVQVGVVEVRVAAVAEANVGGHQRKARLARVLRHAVAVQVNEGACVDIGLPLVHADLAHVADRGSGVRAGAGNRVRSTRDGGAKPPDVVAAAHRDRLCDAVDDLVVPLVEGRDLPVARRDVLEVEIAVRIALREGNFSAVRITQADVALRECQRAAIAAAVQAIVRRAAQPRSGNSALHLIGAGQIAAGYPRVAHPGLGVVVAPLVDGLRIGEADRDVVAGRTEFLEVAGLADAHERVMRLLAIQRVGLDPLLAERDAGRPGERGDAVAARVQVLHDGLARHRRQRLAIALEFRAGDEQAGRRRPGR